MMPPDPSNSPLLSDRLCADCDRDGHTCAAFGCAKKGDIVPFIGRSDRIFLPSRDYPPERLTLWTLGASETGDTREVEYVRADLPPGAVEAFAQERQAVLDCVNLYGDETLHKALDAIGWPADYVGGQ